MTLVRNVAVFAMVVATSIFDTGRSNAKAATPVPAAASPVPNACPTIPHLPNDLPTAFAYELRSPTILRFLTALATLPQRDQKRVFHSVSDAATTSEELGVQSVIAAACPNLEEIYGASRALYLVSNEWKLREFADGKRFSDFATTVSTAVAALSIADSLTPEQRRIAMLPFSDVVPAVTAKPSPAPSTGSCSRADDDAKAVHIVPPDYTPLAGMSGTSGGVLITVSLNDVGDVRSARIFSNTLRRGAGYEDLIRAAIFAAAATTFAPGVHNCETVAGTYLFAVEFNIKRF